MMKVDDAISNALRDETAPPSARLEALRAISPWPWCASAAISRTPMSAPSWMPAIPSARFSRWFWASPRKSCRTIPTTSGTYPGGRADARLCLGTQDSGAPDPTIGTHGRRTRSGKGPGSSLIIVLPVRRDGPPDQGRGAVAFAGGRFISPVLGIAVTEGIELPGVSSSSPSCRCG